MLSFNCKPLRVSQAEYYLDSKEGYYSQDGTVPGVWLGAGARALGLTGRVKDREDVIKVLQGFAPHGLKVQNAGKSERRAGYDLTFSAPKSVTVLLVKAAELAQKDIRRSFALTK
jgi:conjugative relaxase-like TrwC/TraI family protein